jgi:hypothetical protein
VVYARWLRWVGLSIVLRRYPAKLIGKAHVQTAIVDRLKSASECAGELSCDEVEAITMSFSPVLPARRTCSTVAPSSSVIPSARLSPLKPTRHELLVGCFGFHSPVAQLIPSTRPKFLRHTKFLRLTSSWESIFLGRPVRLTECSDGR